MRSFRKILKYNRELKLNRTEMSQVQLSLSEHFKQPVRLKPASGKAGIDQIYSVRYRRRTIAMVRVQNNSKIKPNGHRKWNFRVRLGIQERIEKEWDAYEKLSAIGLSPKPLWRNDIACACSWVDAERAARSFVYSRHDFWDLVDTIFDAVRKMHDLGITHMDLNLGNILLNQKTNTLSFIDFEFGPESWVTESQQRVCDYLILLNEFCRKRRGGKTMLADSERMAGLLGKFIRDEDRSVHLGRIFPQFNRLSQFENLGHALSSVLPNLETQ